MIGLDLRGVSLRACYMYSEIYKSNSGPNCSMLNLVWVGDVVSINTLPRQLHNILSP